jgi:hypothetical protein
MGKGRIYEKEVWGEYGGNILHVYMKIEKQDLLKLFQEWGKADKGKQWTV